MIGLDTNVLVRLLTRDDPNQGRLAQHFIDRHSSSEDPAFINRVVVVELVWVLESYSDYSRSQIADAVESLLSTANFRVEDQSAFRSAVKAYREGADFADALIATINDWRGCSATATFDADARKKLPNFTLIT